MKNYPELCMSIVCIPRADESRIIFSLSQAKNAGASFHLWEELYISNPGPAFRGRIPTDKEVGCNLIGHATSYGYKDVISFLHREGISVNAVADTECRTLPPLFVALAQGQGELATHLLELGALPAPYTRARTALHIAAAMALPKIVRHLAQKSIDVDVEDENGDTPLVYAVASRHATKEIVALLASLGADVNQMTLFKGKNISLLGLACALRQWYLACQLLDCKADSNSRSGIYEGQSLPLELACRAQELGEPREALLARRELIAKLLHHGANPFVQTGHGCSKKPLLAWLIENGHEWEAKCLIHCTRINTEQVDALGQSAIGYALSMQYGSPALAKLLLERGAQPSNILIEDIRRVAQRVRKSNKRKILQEHPKLQDICGLLLDHYTSRSSEGLYPGLIQCLGRAIKILSRARLTRKSCIP
ncbi:hypothetical protein PG991_001728 [Apiospora marii]|uniref:Ankyrin n=1 Tax=Apiospora marii TaxID=335849 RepID=A0ABR1SRW9_9PEZI